MITPPTAPSAGKPVSATFFAQLIRWAKSLALVEGPGYRLHRGPNGTSIEIDAKSVGKSSKIPGCWEMKLSGNSEDGYTAEFTNRYYSVGGRTYEATEETTLENLTGTEIIAVKISADAETTQPTTEVTSYADLGEMQGDQDDEYVYVIPLYKIEDGKVKCDFRLGRVSAMWEFPS